MPPPSVDVIVPVLNEEGSIDEFYRRVDGVGYGDSLIVVDNASTDGTLARLSRYPRVRVIRHATNEGYGASVRDGLAAGTADLVVIIDSDLEYPPEMIPRIVELLRDHAVVYGSRFLGGPPPMPAVRRAGNALVTGLFNLLFRQSTTDLYTGVKGFHRSAVPVDALRRTGFDHAAEISVVVALGGHRIHDVAVPFCPRQHGRSKMRHVREAGKLLAVLLWYWGRAAVRGRGLPLAVGRPSTGTR